MNWNPVRPGAALKMPAVALCIAFALLAVARALPVQSAATIQTDGPMLVRVALRIPADLGRVEGAGVPVYSRLTGDGGAYLLAGASAGQLHALQAQGLETTVLLPTLQGPPLYLVTWRAPGQLAELVRHVRVLHSDGAQALVRLTAAEADALARAGLELARLNPDPIELRPRRHAALPATVQPDPLVTEIIDQVEPAALYQYEQWLTGAAPALVGGQPYTITSRYTYSGASIQKATQLTYEHLSDLGLAVQYHPWANDLYPNVIATQPGTTRPDDILILSAHLDDMLSGPRAPGADDNASGSAAVLVAADILSQYSLKCTLQYALWTGEEQGMRGSDAWAEWAGSQGLNIVGVLNLDMIAYDSDAAPAVDLHARSWLPGSVAMASLFASVVDSYDLDLQPEMLIDDRLGNFSDNKPFWDEGYTAILAIEDYDDFTPYYHTPQDELATLNMAYFAEFVKASLATIAHMGGCLAPDLTGSLEGHVTTAGAALATGRSGAPGPVPGALVTMHRSAGGVFTATTNSTGYYTRTLPSGSYTVTASAAGYPSMTVTNVAVSPNLAAIVDFALEPAPCVPVQDLGFVRAPPAPAAGQVVALSASATGTLPITWTWSFGDGQGGTGQRATHIYAHAGQYPVALTATNCAEHLVRVVKPLTVTRLIYLPLAPGAGSRSP